MLEKVYESHGYVFYKDRDGYYGVVKEGEDPPKHCAYVSLLILAKSKGVPVFGYVF
jgi:hypothetical protein